MEADEGADHDPAADVEVEEAALRRSLTDVDRVRRTLHEEAEDARRRVLGTRARHRPTVDEDARPAGDADYDEPLRRLVEEVEEETSRLREQATDLRAEAGRSEEHTS